MQDTFVFFQFLGKVVSVSELRFTDLLVSLLSINELTIKKRMVELFFFGLIMVAWFENLAVIFGETE